MNIHSGSSLPASKTNKNKMSQTHLKSFITGTYFSPFQGSLIQKRSQDVSEVIFWLFFFFWEFWRISLNCFKWLILLNILDSIEWIFPWMNLRDFVLNWILNWMIFRPDSMKKWIFETRRLPQAYPASIMIPPSRVIPVWSWQFLLFSPMDTGGFTRQVMKNTQCSPKTLSCWLEESSSCNGRSC